MTSEEERAATLLGESALGKTLPAQILSDLGRYTAVVLEANRRFNLTGAKTVEQLVPHILDSLTVAPYVRSPYVDVGSGAGLPGIPIAVFGVETTLVEASAKKAAFLREALARLGLKAAVAHGRAEDLGHLPEYRERFGSATIRAVAAGTAALELAAPFVAVGGLMILQRGRPEPRELETLAEAASLLGCTIEAEQAIGEDRSLMLIRKQAATPDRYPRRPGIPEKRPLCGG